jgi:hypothetical protein
MLPTQGCSSALLRATHVLLLNECVSLHRLGLNKAHSTLQRRHLGLLLLNESVGVRRPVLKLARSALQQRHLGLLLRQGRLDHPSWLLDHALQEPQLVLLLLLRQDRLDHPSWLLDHALQEPQLVLLLLLLRQDRLDHPSWLLDHALQEPQLVLEQPPTLLKEQQLLLNRVQNSCSRRRGVSTIVLQ